MGVGPSLTHNNRWLLHLQMKEETHFRMEDDLFYLCTDHAAISIVTDSTKDTPTAISCFRNAFTYLRPILVTPGQLFSKHYEAQWPQWTKFLHQDPNTHIKCVSISPPTSLPPSKNYKTSRSPIAKAVKSNLRMTQAGPVYLTAALPNCSPLLTFLMLETRASL